MFAEKFNNKLTSLRASGLGILTDNFDSGSRSVLFAPAEGISVETVRKVLDISAGNFFVALSPERASSFLLAPMSRPSTGSVGKKENSLALDMTVSVEAREGVTTGISASDRATTIRVLGELAPNAKKLIKPGHIFPIVVREGGVLVNNALPEGALDIVKLAKFSDAAFFTDVLNKSGDYADEKEINDISKKYELPVFSLDELTHERLINEKLVFKVAEAKLPTKLAGELRTCIYKSAIHGGEHLALIKGEIDSEQTILTRVQPEFTFADVFGGDSPPSRKHLHAALEKIGERGSGVIIYLRRPFRGELKEQVSGSDVGSQKNNSLMMRNYGLGAQILRDLGVRKIDLLTNNIRETPSVKSFGIEIVAQTKLF